MRGLRHAVVTAVLSLSGGSTALAYTDADVLGLELSGELLAPAEMVAQIDADLRAIRQFDPYFADIHVRPAWVPGQVIVTLTPEAWLLFVIGQYHGLDTLKAEYGPVQVVPYPPGRILDLRFHLPYNSAMLAPIYAPADGVQFAGPNHIGGDGDDIVATAPGSYTFQHGWGDCPAGCFAHHYWDFTVTGDLVTLDDERGAPFGACCLADDTCAGAIDQECEDNAMGGLGGTFVGGSCTPNPCGTTAVNESLDRVGWGRLKSRYR